MTIDNFLSFWSQHNTVIIESLVALIIFLSLYVGYRGFFGKKESGGSSSELGGGLDAVQLEKTLQKILEAQNVHARMPAESLDVEVDVDAAAKSAEAAGASPEMAAEVAALKKSLAESRKSAEALQAQVKAAEEKAAQAAADAAAGAGAAPAAGGGEGLAAAEREDLSGKIRDLEARLAEYEIISEDIADLSRYREENEELRKELDNVKAGAVAAAPAAPAPTPAPPPPVEEPAPEVPVAEAAPVEPSVGSDLIDDELMKEFAAAVEGQQNKTLEKAAAKAGAGTESAEVPADDASQLMSEFENFVQKKS